MVLEWWDEEGKSLNSVAVAEKVEEVRRELEQCWGPCVVRDALDQYMQRSNYYYKVHFAFELAFQPLKFGRENAKAAGAEVVKEID